MLPSSVYPYFELDIEQDEMRKAFSHKKLNNLAPFSLFLVFWSNSRRRPLLDSGCLLEKGASKNFNSVEGTLLDERRTFLSGSI